MLSFRIFLCSINRGHYRCFLGLLLTFWVRHWNNSKNLLSASSASSVMNVTLGEFLAGSRISWVSDLFSVVSHSRGDIGVSASTLYWDLNLFFKLSSLFVSWNRQGCTFSNDVGIFSVWSEFVIFIVWDVQGLERVCHWIFCK